MPCGCPDWEILQFPYSGLLPAVKNPGSLCAWGGVGCVDYKCAFMCGITSYSSYSRVFNCCFQVLYFCPGFKTGVKHLYNIISKKRESSKDEGEQKAEKVTNPHVFFICNLASEAVLNAGKM